MNDRSSLPLSQISLRAKERGLLLGGTGTGKSTLADVLGDEFVTRYHGQGARRLYVDSKPRARGEYLMSGLPAKRRYRSWDHGAPIRGSVICDQPADLERAFKMSDTVLIQGESQRDVPRLVACVAEFLKHSRAGRPQLLQIDEVLDFHHPNGMPRGGDDAITRAVRAGRERGTACLLCSQRTKGIPTPLMEELSRAYVFRMDATMDAKRLQEMGAPPELRPPRRPHEFVFWTKASYDRIYGPYKLTL